VDCTVGEEQDQDKTYHPDDSVTEAIQEDDNDVPGDRKFIAINSQLLMLFQWCHTCSLEVELKASTVGTILVVDGVCCDGHILHWQSQPTVNRIPADNLLLAAATTTTLWSDLYNRCRFSGCVKFSYSKYVKFSYV